MTTTAPPAEHAPGLELLGAVEGSGYRRETFLVRRADGTTLQLTPLLHGLLELVDGRRDPDALASALAARTQRAVSAEDVRALLGKLGELGLLAGHDPAVAPVSNPLLALRWKVVVSRPEATERLTRPFAWLFRPLVLWSVLAAFVAVCWFVLVDKGLASATHQAFRTPGLLLSVFALAVLSAGFHELGHAAACRYGGATPGAMGAGLYLVFPAFYTNVDDAYRLDRRGRLRVDLGGLYFNAVVAVAVTGLWLGTRVDALLLGVAVQLLQMLRQLTPVVRADGYHILSDLTGVPDLFAHLGPTLRRVLPSGRREPSPLTRRARVLVTAWVAIVTPVLLSLMLGAVLLIPRLAATAWTSGRVHAAALGTAFEEADLLGVGAGLLKLVALVLPLLGSVYLATRVTRRVVASGWRRTRGRPLARTAFVTAAALVVAAVAWAWWPHGQYRPVRGDERWTLPQLVTGQAAHGPTALVPAAHQQLALAMVPRDPSRPTMLVLRSGDGLRTVLTTGRGGTSSVVGRAFPFRLPPAPGPGDTQALAVNTQDGVAVYDVAYALVTVTDGADVTDVNSAFALASCSDCTTVAVSFQVVLVVGSSSVAAPVNTAVAANDGCLRCVTAALAVQLVITLDALPSQEVQQQLQTILSQLQGVAGLSLDQVWAEVQDVQQQLLEVLVSTGLVSGTTTTTAVASASPGTTAAATAAPSASPSGSAGPAATASPTPGATATPQPTATPTATTATTAEPSPSAS